jgi:hypothetical protein
MFLLSIIRVRPSPTIFASTQPNYLHIYRISCKITKKERRERSLPCYDSHGLIQHVKIIYNNNNNVAAGKPNPAQAPEQALADLEVLKKMLKSGDGNGKPERLQYQL